VAAVAIFIWARLPPKYQALPSAPDDGTVAGVLHIHTSRSDGRSTPEQVAHDAARAGLKFIVFTDHGDATRKPDPPVYREGVLCLDGTEISTSGGHYIAIDMPASPYPLGGEARDVVDDVKRMGGFGIAAHPDSPKAELSWREWTAPFDAIEVLNLDTSWRRRVAVGTWRGKAGLLSRLLTYPFRPAESIASLVARSEVFYRLDALSRRRHVVMLAGADAHAQIAWRASDPIAARLSVPVPSYESSFRAVSVRVRPERPMTGSAATDAALVFRAIRGGHLYSVVDGLATPPSFEFTASNGLGTVREGDQLAVSGPVTLHVRSNAPDGFTTTIWNGVTPVTSDRREREFSATAMGDPAVYWVEIRRAGELAPMPWLTSNPIYVRATDTPAVVPPRPRATASNLLFDGRSTAAWSVEHDPTSLGALDVTASLTPENSLRLRFGLATGAPAGQVVALSVQTPQGVARGDRLTFSARAETPMRISVQMRTQTARWRRSIHVDAFSEMHEVFFDEFAPVGDSATYRAPLDAVRSVLFVVDTTNTKPGASGRLWITAPRVEW